MKALKFTLIVPMLLCALSCKKTSDSAAVVTADQAVDMAAGSISQNSFGFASVADNVSVNAQALTVTSVKPGAAINAVSTPAHQTCGSTLADSISNAGSSSSVTFNYFYKYLRTLNCNVNSQPDNLVNAITFHGNYDGPRLTSADAGTANVTIAGLTVNATNFVVNGEYIRHGSFTSKVGSKATGSSAVDIKATNVLLTKPGRVIISGTATITISGTSANGTFSFTGTLVFHSDNNATLTVGTAVYLINLVTGTSVKQ